MKFEFKISELANQFFFISNLSEWHFSCRKQYNRIWRKTLTPFTKEQKKALEQFTKILKKYEKEEGDVSFPLLMQATTKQTIYAITEGMQNEEKEIVERTFRLFKPSFQQIWKEGRPRLWKFVSLIRNPQYRRKIEKAFKIIEIYFGESKYDRIVVYLFVAPENEWGGGGGNIGPGRLTAEIGDIFPLGIDWASKVIIHETTHKCYQDNFKNLLEIYIKSLSPNSYKDFATVKFFGDLKTVLSELITSSIIEEGIIDELIFKFSSKNQLRRNIMFTPLATNPPSVFLRKTAVLALYPMNSDYLKREKLIDLNYIKCSFEFLKKFEKKYKKGKIKELAYL